MEYNKYNKTGEKGDYVLSLNESSGKVEPAKVNGVLDMGFKPIYEMTTESGKSINTTKEHPYLVKLYSEEDCENYEGDVWNKEYDEFNGEVCTRWISVSELREGMEIGFQKDLGDNQISPFRNTLINSDVLSTGTSDCSFKCLSFDQIVELVDNASAKKSMSLRSEISLLAFIKNSSYSEDLMNLMDSSSSFCLISNSCSESFDLDNINFLYFSNSDFINSGAINSAFIEENKYAVVENGFISENKELLSKTNLIFYSYFPLCSGDMVFNNLSFVFGDTSLSSCLNLPSLAFLPSSTDHFINSCSSGEFNFSSNCIFLLSKNDFTKLDQFIHENSDISAFNSLSTANVIDAIYITPFDFNSSSFLSSLTLSDTTLRAIAATFTSGNCSLNSFNNLSGIDTVILGILVSPDNYFNTSKDVELFKSFDSKLGYCTHWISVSELDEENYIAVPKIEDYKEMYLSRLGGHSAPKTLVSPQVLIQNELSRLGQGTNVNNEEKYLNFSNDENYFNLNNFNKSLVENTFTFDCFLNAFSSDQIGRLNDNASAKYKSPFVPSLGGESLLASCRNLSYSNVDICFICFSSNLIKYENSISSIEEGFVN